MESTRLEEENIIKDIRNLFRLKKEQNYTVIKDTRNLFTLEKKKLKQLKIEKKNKYLFEYLYSDIENLFEYEKDEVNYYKPVRVSNFWNNNYIEYESNGDRNKALSVEELPNKIRLFLQDVINNLKKSDTWKIQLTIANNFISSTDNDEERVMHSKSDNIEIMSSDKAGEVIKELFDSLKSKNQNNLESMKGSELSSIMFI